MSSVDLQSSDDMTKADSANPAFAARHKTEKPLWFRLAWLPIPLLIVIMAVFADAKLGGIHDSFYLRLALNVAFLTLVFLFVAYLVGRSFLSRSTPGLLLLGCGALIWGVGAVAAIVLGRRDVNVAVTIFNLGTCLAALCHLVGVSLSLRPKRPLNPAGLWLASGYVVALFALGLISIFTIDGRIPIFFVEGQGSTTVRHLVLGSAVAMFALAAILLWTTNRKSLSTFAHWYSYALALFAVGLFGTLFPSSFSSVLFWTARSTQWLGGVYMLIAAIVSVRESHVWGISLEAALYESEERFRSMYEHAAVGIGQVAVDGRLIMVNEALCRMLGYSEEELHSKTCEDISHPDDRDRETVLLAAMLRGERDFYEIEKRYLRRDGSAIWVNLTSSPVKDTEGKLLYRTSIIQDVTERKRAEEERETTIEFLRLMSRSRGTRDLIQRATTFFQQRSACEAVGIRLQEGGDYPYFEYRGFSKEFVLAENLLCKPDESGRVTLDNTGHPALDCMCGNVIRGRFDPSKPFFTANGSFWANDTTSLLATTTDADRQAGTRNRCNGEGYESVALIAIGSREQRLGLLQLNDRQKGRFSLETILLWERLAGYLAAALSKFRAEEAVQQERDRLSALINGVSDEIWFADAEKKFTLANPAALREFSYDSNATMDVEKLAASLEVFRPDGSPRPIEEAPPLRALRGELVKDQEEIVRTPSTGDFRHRQVSSAPVKDATGKIIGSVSVVRDITERKQAEQALLRSEKLASVGRMAATIAHEINNPLEAVMSLLFLAKGDKELPESVRQYLETADAELKRITHITRQSLGFYRESNAPALTSVIAVLESAVDLLKSRIKAKHAVIEKQWDSDVMVTAVAGELRQVFSNLLVNSLDAIDAKGTIRLRVSSGPALNNGDRCVRVTVADNGKGISASSRQHLFEPFFTTKGTIGTGLGLWVSKQIIDKHGGTIRMRSSNNGARRGTVFSVVLPINAAAAASPSAGV